MRQTKTFQFGQTDCSFSVPKKSVVPKDQPEAKKAELEERTSNPKKRKAEEAKLEETEGRKILKRNSIEAPKAEERVSGRAQTRNSRSAPQKKVADDLAEVHSSKEEQASRPVPGIQPILKKATNSSRVDYIKMNKM